MALIRFTLAGDSEFGGHSENVFTFQTDEEVDEGNSSEVLGDFYEYLVAALIDALINFIADTFLFNEIRLEKCTDVVEGTWVGLGTQAISVPGEQATGTQLPEFLAVRTQANTTGPGRKGSKFISFLDETQWAVNAWSVALLAAVADFSNAYTDSFIGFETGIAYAPGVYRTVAGLFDPFSGSFAVDTTASHQDRREAGIGI